MPHLILDESRAIGIDLSLIPPADVIETIDYERILADRKARFLSLLPVEERPAMQERLSLESEPITLLLEELAYAEMLIRSRINEAARQCHLASATGTNLDHLAALLGVHRLMTHPGNPSAIPPVSPTWETDTRLRYRAQLAVEGMSTAGPIESYRFHALSADGRVADASVISPIPGQVVVSILGNEGDGTPPPDLLAVVNAYLNGETIRPLTDEVIVQAATLVPYQIEAVLTLYPGPAPQPVIEAATDAVNAYIRATRRIGYDVTRSGLFAALHRAGVQNVALIEPAADIVIAATEVAWCDDMTIELSGGVDV